MVKRSSIKKIPKEIEPLKYISVIRDPSYIPRLIRTYKDASSAMTFFRLSTIKKGKIGSETLVDKYKLNKYENFLELMEKQSPIHGIPAKTETKNRVLENLREKNIEDLQKKSLEELQDIQKNAVPRIRKIVLDTPQLYAERLRHMDILAKKGLKNRLTWLESFNLQLKEAIAKKKKMAQERKEKVAGQARAEKVVTPRLEDRAKKALDKLEPYRGSMNPDIFEAEETQVVKKLIEQTPKGLTAQELETIKKRTGIPDNLLSFLIKDKRKLIGDEEKL